jgi:predicted lipoprotein with Yx(FWY)xxD motif
VRFANYLAPLLAFSASSLILTGCAAASVKRAPSGNAKANLETPPGITFRTSLTEIGSPFYKRPENPRLYAADADNRVLFSFDEDEPGKSKCAADCATNWPAALAPAHAKKLGEWSIIKRADTGAAQWTFRNRPLYTSAKDSAKASGKPDPSYKPAAATPASPGATKESPWHPLELKPNEHITRPSGFDVTEVLMAPGQALIDSNERTIYSFSGKLREAKDLSYDWVPVQAPSLAQNVGNFSVLVRSDGQRQWMMNGRPLYTYRRDWVLGDANGRSVDSRIQVAVVMPYFLPAAVDILPDERRGGLMVVRGTGQALYTRDMAFVDGEGGQNTRGARGNPFKGQVIGTTACEGECTKSWTPLAAPNDAVPSGYWSVFTRSDGQKQWAYQGFALYSMNKDKPGQINGQNEYHFTVAMTTQEKLPTNLGMFWHAVAP